METNYYSKYLKYKNKYIQLKEQIGGLDAKYLFTDCTENGKITVNNEENWTYIKDKNNNIFNIQSDINKTPRKTIEVDNQNICSNICTGENHGTEKHFFSFDDSCKNEIEQTVLNSNLTKNKRNKKIKVCDYKKKTCPPPLTTLHQPNNQ
jgi:hypothetical protein